MFPPFCNKQYGTLPHESTVTMFHLKGCTLGWFRSEGVDCCRNNRLYPIFHILWLEVVSVGGPGLVDYLLCSCKCRISLFQEMYELLAILDFNNERKRMSVSCKIKKKLVCDEL